MSQRSTPRLPIDALLDPRTPAAPPADAGTEIGRSRENRPIRGFRLGRGPAEVSLIAGCHADEPVGPRTLDRLAAHLLAHPELPLLDRVRFHLVPHVNPDGEARNAAWTRRIHRRDGGRTVYDLGAYLRHVVREAPGDDVEFGFPTDAGNAGARPENRAVADFLRPAAPFALHGSLHGMAFGMGPWFLVELGWAEHTRAMREALRRRVAALGYRVHEVDRGGEKGFTRIDEGFTSRPDSRAMRAHFEARGEPAMAERFRPSSMEMVRAWGGEPLTIVSEMPLFLLPETVWRRGDDPVRPPAVAELRNAAAHGEDELAETAASVRLEPMAIEDQMRLQLAFVEEALAAALG